MSKMGQPPDAKADLIHDFLASAHVFAAAVDEEEEEALLKKAGGRAVTASQLKLLKLVGTSEAQTISGVASFLGISNAAASKAVDRLVRRKLLSRREGAADRRFMNLSLTEPGSRVLQDYEEARQQRLLEMFADFPEEELLRAAALMDRMSMRVVEAASGAGDICLKCGIYFKRECLVRKIQGRRCFYIQLQAQQAERARGRRKSAPPETEGGNPPPA